MNPPPLLEQIEASLRGEGVLRIPSPEDLLGLMTRLNLSPHRSLGSRVDAPTLKRSRREAADVLAGRHCIAIDRSGSLIAAAIWAVQDWDSVQLRRRTAKLELLGPSREYFHSRSATTFLLQKALTACAQSGVSYLTTRTDADELATIHALQHSCFEMVDGIQTYVLDIADNGLRERPKGIEVGLYQDFQQDQIVEIAKSAYHFDRFHADPALDSELADSLHGDWLRNSCNGFAADAVVTARRGEEVLGYVTLKFDRRLEALGGPKVATIVLVAVKETGQGIGVGRYMTEWTIDWLRSVGTTVVLVGTQLTNVPAARLYESVGFRYAGSSFTLRRLI